MMRFDEEFISVNGPTLRQIISDTDRDGAWPMHYSKTIIPYSILDSRTYLGETSKKFHSFGLVDLDPAPHFDLVIIDEAHHIRNGSMEKEKAFEYKCVKYFCDNADAVVMLTATPLQTSDDDLFTLLNVLRPDIVIDEKTFQVMSRPNKYISEAVKTIRRADDNWQNEALTSLQRVMETQWGENVIATNPDFKSLIRSLHKKSISREERVQLISYAENLHSFNSMLNRTRRKDIQDFCIRRPFTLAVDFTPRQKMLHDELLLFEQKALLHLHGSSKSIAFMMTTIKRQAASCIFGLAPHIRDLISRRFQQFEDNLDYDSPGVPLKGDSAKLLEQLANKIINMAVDLPDEDPKFDKMLEVIMEKQKQDNNKVIIFSTFRYTLGYLNSRLKRAGIRVGQIDGSVNDSIRQELRDDIVHGIYSEESNGKTINTERTIAELLSYVVFPICRGSKRNPRILEGSSIVYEAAKKACGDISVKNIDAFRAISSDFMAFHTDRDIESGFARRYRHRLTRDMTLALLGHTCPYFRYDINKKRIVEEQIDSSQFISQLILAYLKKNYKL